MIKDETIQRKRTHTQLYSKYIYISSIHLFHRLAADGAQHHVAPPLEIEQVVDVVDEVGAWSLICVG
jgi:hypothetical protein